MNKLRIDLADRSYDILIGRSFLPKLGDFLPNFSDYKRSLIVTNPAIHRLYGETLKKALQQIGLESDIFEIPEGETHKTIQIAQTVYDHLVDSQCDRRTLMFALGGGVVGDLTGFVAATYQRGVPYVQVPTSLLAQVDSSVGGKTAVNHPKGKNLIGAFYQPKTVIIDLETLKTLPDIEFRAGLAEIIKYGVIEDPNLFSYLEDHVDQVLSKDAETLIHIIKTSCSIKAKVVEKDETESNYRMVLNFGHTFGHAIEALSQYSRYKHGEAVAMGMVYAAKLSQSLGKCLQETVERIEGLIKQFNLPTQWPEYSKDKYLDAMYLDKKVRDKKMKFILVKEIGKVEIVDHVTEQHLIKLL